MSFYEGTARIALFPKKNFRRLTPLELLAAVFVAGGLLGLLLGECIVDLLMEVLG